MAGNASKVWLKREEEAIGLQDLAHNPPLDVKPKPPLDVKPVLSELIFVRTGHWPHNYRRKMMRREGDQISIADLCAGTILDSSVTNPRNYELRMVVQASGGLNVMFDVRCVKKAHYANLSRVSTC